MHESFPMVIQRAREEKELPEIQTQKQLIKCVRGIDLGYWKDCFFHSWIRDRKVSSVVLLFGEANRKYRGDTVMEQIYEESRSGTASSTASS